MKKSILAILLLCCFVAIFAQANSSSIFKSVYIKKAMTTAAKWQLNHPKNEVSSKDWTSGAFYSGVFALYKTTKSKWVLDSLMAMGNRNSWQGGPTVKLADDHAICQTYIDLYRISKDRKMIEPYIQMMDSFTARPYSPKGIKKIALWWCDALFMVPPAFVKLGMTLNDKKYLEFNDSLYKECYNLLYDKDEHLFARDLGYKPDVIREANGAKVFWSRGNGWVMGGLALMLSELPKDYKQRPFYIQLFKEMAERVSGLQQSDGLWRASLLDPNSFPGGETSGSGFYTFAIAWGINNGMLEKSKYLPVVKKAWIGLNNLIQPDGHVGWCQPIGQDPKKNFSADSWEVFGTGAFLLAGSEVIKLK